MTIQEARNLFENLKNETSKKSAVKIYDKFLHILTELKARELSNEDTKSIETKLSELNFSSEQAQNLKFYKKTLADFEKFLKESLSLTSKSYYTNIGMGLGMSFGVLFGLVFLSSFDRSKGISYGILIGMFVGLLIGRNMDAKAAAEGKVI